jgi:hypothetical protein
MLRISTPILALVIIGLTGCGAEVTVKRTGTGANQGVVRSTPAGIDCGSVCSARVSGEVRLEADAPDGVAFGGWSGACEGTESCVLTEGGTVEANFLLAHPIKVAVRGDGEGKIEGELACEGSCTAYVDAGEGIRWTPKPAPGSVFVGWSGACKGTGICELEPTAPTAVVARFDLAPGTVLAKSRSELVEGERVVAAIPQSAARVWVVRESGDGIEVEERKLAGETERRTRLGATHIARARDVEATGEGGFFIAGALREADCAVVHFDKNLEVLFSRAMPDCGEATAVTMLTDDDGEALFIAGHFGGFGSTFLFEDQVLRSGGNKQLFLARYTSEGSFKKVEAFGTKKPDTIGHLDHVDGDLVLQTCAGKSCRVERRTTTGESVWKFDVPRTALEVSDMLVDRDVWLVGRAKRPALPKSWGAEKPPKSCAGGVGVVVRIDSVSGELKGARYIGNSADSLLLRREEVVLAGTFGPDAHFAGGWHSVAGGVARPDCVADCEPTCGEDETVAGCAECRKSCEEIVADVKGRCRGGASPFVAGFSRNGDEKWLSPIADAVGASHADWGMASDEGLVGVLERDVEKASADDAPREAIILHLK